MQRVSRPFSEEARLPVGDASLLPLFVFVAAALYASVGHGGASGYLAAMALLAVAPSDMKVTALLLNLVVSSVASVRFGLTGHFRWRLFAPFALASIPSAFLGATILRADSLFRQAVGLTLLYSAARMFILPPTSERSTTPPNLAVALCCGALIGLLAGVTGTGGGIFLSPLIVLLGWGSLQEAASVSAVFIFLNSSAALAGHFWQGTKVPDGILPLALSALMGGWIGARFGTSTPRQQVLRRLLAAVLVIAAIKLMLGA